MIDELLIVRDAWRDSFQKDHISGFVQSVSHFPFYRSTITHYIDGSEVEDTPILGNNDFYSPACFTCIKDVIHLFPFSSRAIYDTTLRNIGIFSINDQR